MNDFIEVDGQQYVSMERYRELSAYCQQLRNQWEILRSQYSGLIGEYNDLVDKLNGQNEILRAAALISSRALGEEREAMILLNLNQEDVERLTELALKKRRELPKYQPGYIYIIKDIDVTGYCKIGCSVEPQSRLRHFGAKLPFRCEMIHMFKVKNMRDSESSLHQKYKSKRIRGEWFKLSRADLEYIKSIKDE